MILLSEDEKILATIRKHWLILLKDTLFLSGLLIVPVIILTIYYIAQMNYSVEFNGNGSYLYTFFFALWLLWCWNMIFIIWTDYYLDVLIITNKRILDIEQKGLFSRESSSFRLDRIQDITVEVRGVIATYLNFGHIHIQTAGESRAFIARYIPRPYEVKKQVSDMQNTAIEKHQANERTKTITEPLQ